MKSKLIILGAALLIAGCGKHNQPAPILPPTAASLSSPAQNAVCESGQVISDSQSSITFQWSASNHTDSYQLNIKNLLTGTTSSQTTSNTQATVTLQRNTPYSWNVVSESTKTATTAQSDTWKFYVAGVGAITYAPFPADLISPGFGEVVTATNDTVSLTWTGSSVDKDIVGYDVYFGTATNPPLFKSGLKDTVLNNVNVSSGTTYFWKVVTKDSVGNTSDSEVSQFIVK